jgi:aspartate/methionine/tyrosine aminotransferase
MMPDYLSMDAAALRAELGVLEGEFAAAKALGLSLNMARGNPSKEQLALSMPMLDVLTSESDLMSEGGQDCRNYGAFDGIPEAKALLAGICGARPEQVVVFGNSSLNIMFDLVAHAWTHGVCGSEPWGQQASIKFLCPSPGYDRHFGVTEFFGIELVPVEMREDGPDMGTVEALVAADPAIKGIWCVPKYSNPTGVCYSDEVVRRFARLAPAAPDFRIFWDNAYAVHHIYEEEHPALLNILDECAAAGNPDMAYMFCSTSKITFAGGGIAGLASSEANLADFKAQLNYQTIGHDKVNELRHVRFLRDQAGVEAQMRKHAAIIRPKFELVERMLTAELGGTGLGRWTHPRGGYFVSFNTLPGCAKAVVALAKEAGVTLTGAGRTYPYGKDPEDSNIRIAPTYPPIAELEQALEVFITCVKLASVRRLLAEKTAA